MNGPCVRLTEGADVSRTVAVCIIMPSATLVEAESAKPSTCGGLTPVLPVPEASIGPSAQSEQCRTGRRHRLGAPQARSVPASSEDRRSRIFPRWFRRRTVRRQTGTTAPVTAPASSEARKAMTAATASVDTQSDRLLFGIAARFPGVSMVLGATALTVMP
jgi:hypothetical protein